MFEEFILFSPSVAISIFNFKIRLFDIDEVFYIYNDKLCLPSMHPKGMYLYFFKVLTQSPSSWFLDCVTTFYAVWSKFKE